MPIPELSIIIPTLNEAEVLPLLLGDLARQQKVSFEVIVADGRSADATCQIANQWFASGRLQGSCHVGPNGRGRQLNAGAELATSPWLLFLHADSHLPDPHQLHIALDFMRTYQRQEACDSSAGHFALSFDIPVDKSLGLFFYETKARLGRRGCINGDQGLLLTKEFFHRVGPFHEDLPVMEDTRLAEAIHASGRWLLLPGDIITSARRFQVEGLKARQTLNALMMNFLSIGWLEFFERAPDIYRQQDRTRPLQLLPFFLLIKDLFAEKPLRRRWALWMSTGAYVRSQAWQIGLALDCRKAFRMGIEPGHQPDRWMN
ncbi:MAG: TIGR04283 family arsenosugar biosynthesis glycosyltransferase, partial [Desulfuromonadales bacterium]